MFKVAVCGCGVVGSGVADILIQQKEKLSARFNTEVCLGYILDIRDFEGTPYAPYMAKDVETILADEDVKLFSVTIGGLDFAYQLCRRALEAGRHVVTSNKEVVAAYGRELEQLAYDHRVRFLYEASAGGGIPVIRPLNICIYANDIYEIQGILNGTTNYMLTGMYRDKMSFDDILKDAQAKGFAEANPSADVDGYDAARKIAILSSISYGAWVDYNDVACTGIREVVYADHELAASAGYAIKLIAGSKLQSGEVQVSVEPKLVPRNSMLASVNSVYNAVLTKGSYTGDTLFYGQGAGKLATASAVLGDIIEILGRPSVDTLPPFVNKNANVVKEDHASYRFFVRFKAGFSEDETDEIAACVRSTFGSASNFIGFALADSTLGGFITDYCTKKELTTLLDKFTSVANVEIQYTIKVLD